MQTRRLPAQVEVLQLLFCRRVPPVQQSQECSRFRACPASRRIQRKCLLSTAKVGLQTELPRPAPLYLVVVTTPTRTTVAMISRKAAIAATATVPVASARMVPRHIMVLLPCAHPEALRKDKDGPRAVAAAA